MCYLWRMETTKEQARIVCECSVVFFALLYLLKGADQIERLATFASRLIAAFSVYVEIINY